MTCECGVKWRVRSHLGWIEVQSLEAAIFAARSIYEAEVQVYSPSLDKWLDVVVLE